MKPGLEKYKKKFSNLTSGVKRDRFGTPAASQRDWKIIYGIFLVLLLVVVTFNMWRFYQVSVMDHSQDQASEASAAQTIDRSRLQDKINQLENRQAQYELLRDQVPSVANPSN